MGKAQVVCDRYALDTLWYRSRNGGGSGSGSQITVPNAAALSAYPDATLTDEQPVWVSTYGRNFRLVKSSVLALKADVVLATLSGIGRWISDDISSSETWLFQTDYGVDRILGNNENIGTKASPLKSNSELYRRLGTGRRFQGASLTIDQNEFVAASAAADPLSLDIYVDPETLVTVTGTPQVTYSGSVTGLVTHLAAATNTPNSFQDTNLTGTWTTHINERISWKTIAGAAVTTTYSWPMKDLGATTARTNSICTVVLPASQTAFTLTERNATFAIGDTYDLQTLPIVFIGTMNIRCANTAVTGNKGTTLFYDGVTFGSATNSNATVLLTIPGTAVRVQARGCQQAYPGAAMGSFFNASELNVTSTGALAIGTTGQTISALASRVSLNVYSQGAGSTGVSTTSITTNSMVQGAAVVINSSASASLSNVCSFDGAGSGITVGAAASILVTGTLYGANANARGYSSNNMSNMSVVGAIFGGITITGTGGDLSNGTLSNVGPTVVDPITGVTLLKGGNAPVTQTWANMTNDYNDAANTGGYQVPAASSVTGAAIASFLEPQSGARVGTFT